MNLLDQLANFCNRSVSINLMEPYHKEQDQNNRLPRHHSMTIATRLHDDRHAKSIDKIQTWAPSNKHQSKQKTIFKFVRTLNNKTRNHYFYFWVNLQQALKNKKTKPNNRENISVGLEKLSVFVSAFQNRYLQCTLVPQTFSKLQKFALYSQTIKHVQNSVGSCLRRQRLEFFVALQQKQRVELKLDIFMNSIGFHFQQVLKQVFLSLVNVKCQPLKAQLTQGQAKAIIISDLQTSIAKPLKISILKSLQPNQSLHQAQNILLLQTNELPAKTLSKICADQAVENCSEICDNNLLFIQKPFLRNESVKAQNSTSKQKQVIMAKTNRSHCKPQLQTSHLVTEPSERNEIHLTQNKMAMNNLRTLPRQRSISSSSILKVDESRMTKLEKKLFGSPQTSHPHDRSYGGDDNRFSVNGQDWKTDRKALQQIMSTIKLPAKMSMERRRSEYEIQTKAHWGQNNKQKVYAIKTKQNWSRAKVNSNQKSQLMNCLLNGAKNTNPRCEKIVISLKSKKVNYDDPTLRNKSEHWQKLYQQEKETRRLIHDWQR